MECAVCKAEMRWAYEDDVNGILSESIEVCDNCGMYEVHFAYGATKEVIRGVDYLCGDPRTTEGNRLAWLAWHAIVEAREAFSNESHD